MRTLRQIHAAVAWFFVATIVYQVYLAGAAIANLGGSGDFSNHASFGFTIVGLAALAVLLTAVIARMPRRDIGWSFGLLLLYVLQTMLPGFKADAPWVAALHPVNAMLIFGLSVWYARHVWIARKVEGPPAGAGLVAAPAPDSSVPDAR